MRNFGPYRGEQEVSFPLEDGQGVMVVFGANMRGKTSLLNAIRWALFGRALDRQGRPMDLSKLINWQAQRAFDWPMWVAIAFEAHGDHFEIRRRAEPRGRVVNPTSARDFAVDVLLKKNGDPIEGDKIQAQINHFIPEEVSRFYLFDGELLQEYEALLLQDDDQGRRIKEAIEKVLGVPALIHGRDELRTLLKRAQVAQANEARHSQVLEGQATLSLTLQQEIETHRNQGQELESRIEQCSSDVREIDAELIATEEVRLKIIRAEGLKRELESVHREEDENTKRRHDALKGAWKDLLQPQMHLVLTRLTEKLNAEHQVVTDRGALLKEIEQLRSLLKRGECGVCGAVLSEKRRRSHELRAASLEQELDAARHSVDDLALLAEQVKAVRRIGPTGALKALTDLENDAQRRAVRVTQIETAMEEIEEALRSHDVARISTLQRKRDGLVSIRARLSVDLDDLKRKIDEKTAKCEQISRQMSKTPEGRRQRSSREVAVCSALVDIFDKSIDVLREALRGRVAEAASRVFLALTTEKTYRGLSINANYGLTIIDKDGRAVSVRSAGAEQVVAMALLCALNQTADRPGPVVIDTPFARLDPEHRLNILRFVPEMAKQVVFLVHEGEIPRNGGLAPIASHIGATYEIERISSDESHIVRVNS
jgi:DNA sulfur modification protein DndD